MELAGYFADVAEFLSIIYCKHIPLLFGFSIIIDAGFCRNIVYSLIFLKEHDKPILVTKSVGERMHCAPDQWFCRRVYDSFAK